MHNHKEMFHSVAMYGDLPGIRFERAKPLGTGGDCCDFLFRLDETFDAVTSNYVYHNITGKNKQALLRETLRVLKKGGTFAIRDLLEPVRYGDMGEFVEKRKAEGYEDVQRLKTTNGMFMNPGEAKRMTLVGSTLLIGRK